jgi:hypothetical protein
MGIDPSKYAAAAMAMKARGTTKKFSRYRSMAAARDCEGERRGDPGTQVSGVL